MKWILKVLCMTAMGTVVSHSQQVYTLVPDTKRNQIELTVANESPTSSVDGVSVHLETTRPWLSFASTAQGSPVLDANREATVTFTFAVNRSAPVSKKDTLEFVVRDKSGSLWRKSIVVQYAGPATFALDQNFPNPFNPTTTIQYQLPTDSRVTLKVYDLLGREVTTLLNEDRPAGYHDARWDASNTASGVYFYRIDARPLNNSQNFQQVKKLMVMK